MAQSVGLNLLAKALQEGRLADFYLLKREFFYREEVQVYDWINAHVERHGVLPSLLLTKRRTKAIKDCETDDPYGVWHHEYINRALFNKFNELLPSVSKLTADKKSAEALDKVISFVEEAQSIQSNGQRDLATIDRIGAEVMADFVRRRDAVGLSGIPTGFKTLDAATHGYQKGTLNIFAARPGVGKTTLAVKTLLEAHRAGKIPLFVSMEMKRVQIGSRLMAMAANLNLKAIRKGELTTFAEERLQRTTEMMIGQHPLYILEGQFRKTVNDIKSLVQSLRPDILIVDGAYLMKLPTTNSRMPLWERIGAVAEALNNIGLTSDIPVWASVQINREGGKVSRAGKDLGVEHLMLADAIGQLAHLVVALFEDDTGDNPDAEKQRRMKTLKGREGEQAEIILHWDYEKMNFDEIEDPLEAELEAAASAEGEEYD